MKRPFLVLILSLSIGGSAFFTGCQKKQADEKAAVETKSETSTPAPAATPTNDTTAQAANTTSAQEPSVAPSQRFGYINTGELIKLMPEAKRADANLTAYVRNLENQFGALQKDYQSKITDFQAQERTMIDAVKQTRIKAITDLEQQMQQAQMVSQQQIAAKREQLFKPVLDKAEKAIQEVGKENGYDYIFDTSSGSFIYAKESHDVLPLVKTKLAIK
ncbi:OmpH family outer membrane protein [Adhaeribacter aquaticus]|uniref:OmpH family outer membrane protein n=1 Tax=Adhaeribacter aquaticus TaxID=299567 RepID=UPI00042169CE|nr:OmpH family outer membrane protein [Adhaeribacter aquaticus]